MALIASQTLSSPTATISISSIPQTFRHLLLLMEMRSDRASTANDNVLVRFNGDSGASNYYRFNYQVLGSPPAFGGNYTNALGNGLSLNQWSMLGAAAAAGLRSAIVMHIFDYAALRQRQVTYYGYTPAGSLIQGGGYWVNTAAGINAISIASGTGSNLVAPSTYALYGLQ
jgi:hypothetical protein